MVTLAMTRENDPHLIARNFEIMEENFALHRDVRSNILSGYQFGAVGGGNASYYSAYR